MGKFDPNEATADEVVKKLEKADEEERRRIVAEERQGKGRKTVLEAAGVNADERTDRQGRVLYPWELSPEDHVRVVEPSEAPAQEATGSTPQGASTPAGSGSAADGTAGPDTTL